MESFDTPRKYLKCMALKRSKLKRKSTSETTLVKDEIQAVVRLIVTKRDKGCILRKQRCGVIADVMDDKVLSLGVIQADHLITRGNAATFADTRLIVCLCRGCHGWKHWHKEQYDALVKSVLPRDRVELWERAEQESWKPKRTSSYDWKLTLFALKQELKEILKSGCEKRGRVHRI